MTRRRTGVALIGAQELRLRRGVRPARLRRGKRATVQLLIIQARHGLQHCRRGLSRDLQVHLTRVSARGRIGLERHAGRSHRLHHIVRAIEVAFLGRRRVVTAMTTLAVVASFRDVLRRVFGILRQTHGLKWLIQKSNLLIPLVLLGKRYARVAVMAARARSSSR